MHNRGKVINNSTILETVLCEINSIIKNNIISYERKIYYYELQCKWKLVFDNNILLDVKSKSQYRRSLSHSFEKYLKNIINHYEKRGLKFSRISELNITFTALLEDMT